MSYWKDNADTIGSLVFFVIAYGATTSLLLPFVRSVSASTSVEYNFPQIHPPSAQQIDSLLRREARLVCDRTPSYLFSLEALPKFTAFLPADSSSLSSSGVDAAFQRFAAVRRDAVRNYMRANDCSIR